MTKKILASALIGIFLFAGCAGPQPTPQLSAAQSMGDGYICKGATCKDNWTKTQLWIHRHSNMKIQIANDSMIQTYGSIDYANTFTATKEPLGNNSYKIKMEVGGGNPYDSYDLREVEKSFYYYLKYGKDLLVPIPRGFYHMH